MTTFKNPISGETIKMAQHNFPNLMNLPNAKLECSNLGEGWRLPSYYELKVMRDLLLKDNDHEPQYYWTNSNSYTTFNDHLNPLDISKQELPEYVGGSVAEECNVRAVKTID